MLGERSAPASLTDTTPGGTSMRAIVAVAILLAFVGTGQAVDPRQVVPELAGPFIEGKKNLGLVVGVVTPAGRSVFGYGTVVIGPAEVVPDGDTIFELG